MLDDQKETRLGESKNDVGVKFMPSVAFFVINTLCAGVAGLAIHYASGSNSSFATASTDFNNCIASIFSSIGAIVGSTIFECPGSCFNLQQAYLINDPNNNSRKIILGIAAFALYLVYETLASNIVVLPAITPLEAPAIIAGMASFFALGYAAYMPLFMLVSTICYLSTRCRSQDPATPAQAPANLAP